MVFQRIQIGVVLPLGKPVRTELFSSRHLSVKDLNGDLSQKFLMSTLLSVSAVIQYHPMWHDHEPSCLLEKSGI